jgi:hypothetical protein
MNIQDRDMWEDFRRSCPELHGYSFSFRWIDFQAHWHEAERITMALAEEGRTKDLFAGMRNGKYLFAGPDRAPGGCSDPHNLNEFLTHFSRPKTLLCTNHLLDMTRDVNFDMLIDLENVESPDHYIRQHVSSNARRSLKKAKAAGFQARKGNIDEFCECYREMAARNHVRKPFPPIYFSALEKTLGDELILKTFHLKGRVVGASMLFITPSQVHDYFVISKSEAFSRGLPSLLFMDMIEEAFLRKKPYVNCGPSSPWDGSFEFKRRFGAKPKQINAYLLNANIMERTIFFMKSGLKKRKSRAALSLQAA